MLTKRDAIFLAGMTLAGMLVIVCSLWYHRDILFPSRVLGVRIIPLERMPAHAQPILLERMPAHAQPILLDHVSMRAPTWTPEVLTRIPWEAPSAPLYVSKRHGCDSGPCALGHPYRTIRYALSDSESWLGMTFMAPEWHEILLNP